MVKKEEKAQSEQQGQQEANQNHPEFAIQRLYVKDVSFETPNTPSIFRTEWKPKVNLDLHTETKKLEDKVHEVVLKVTVTVNIEDKTAFLVEVKQAGIFTLGQFTDDQLKHMLSSFCPNILFPYAREAVSDLVNRGGFPPLYLAPINFDALYQQQMQQQAEKAKATEK